MTVQYRVHRAPGRDTHIAGKTPDKQLTDLPGAPMRLLALAFDNHPINGSRQLIGIPHGPARTVAQRLKAVIPVTIENLVPGLAGNPELPAQIAHAFTLKTAGDKS
jgi:hypothetical protein